MKGDFSRLTYEEANQYSRVLMQQGRVLLDADWNESAEIQVRNLRALARDLMGPHAAPTDPDGGDGTDFLIGPAVDANQNPVKNDFSVGQGTYYVQGIPCRNVADSTYRTQADLADDGVAFNDSTLYLVYLDVWERHITATETDGPLDEPALRGADTCTRSKVVWQIRTRALDGVVKPDIRTNYQSFLNALGATDPGSLAARVDKPADPDSPCISAPESKYRGTENQLYRVEIHTGGATPTFKWSRENGSEIYPVTDVSGASITVQSTGRDDRSSLEPDDMVELVDDQYTLLNKAAPLMRVSIVDRENGVVTVDQAPASNTGVHRYLRRWQSGEIDIAAATATAVNGWIPLEDGIQVKFDIGKRQLATGQYWTIPARTATGDVIWPQSGGKPAFRTPAGVEHGYAPLAMVAFNADRTINTDKITDLRRLLTKIWK
jgi:hypothetical protein